MSTPTDEFSTAFSAAFDPAAAPTASCVPWTIDLGCISDDDWALYPPDVQARATDLAWASIRFLTAGRVGSCPVTARPCRQGCQGVDVGYYGGPPWQPMVTGGTWINVGCGCGRTHGCSCTEVCEVAFPGPIAQVDEVKVDGDVIDPTAYRVDNTNLLVRQDGDCWPLCQDMNLPADADGTFAVTYVPGIVPSPAGLWAAGLLTVEFAKACTGGKCRLPTAITSLSRQGVTFEFEQGMFAGGATGIREVDAWVQSVNPNHLAQQPRIWSPDMRSPRYTTA